MKHIKNLLLDKHSNNYKGKKMNQKNLFLDVETTGFSSHRDSIVEIGAIYELNCEIIETFQVYIYHEDYPKEYYKATKVHGLTKEFLKDKGISEAEAFKKLILFLDRCINKYDKDDKLTFLAYSSPFDWRFISSLFTKHHHKFIYSYFNKEDIDVLKLAKEVTSKRLLEAKDNKLGTIAKALEVPLINSHSASEDIKCTRTVYYELLKLKFKDAETIKLK